jgi:hypothetical protein
MRRIRCPLSVLSHCLIHTKEVYAYSGMTQVRASAKETLQRPSAKLKYFGALMISLILSSFVPSADDSCIEFQLVRYIIGNLGSE